MSIIRKARRFLIPAAAVTLFAGVGSVLAAVQSPNLLSSPIYGNIPNVTVRGVGAGKAPWVVSGHAVLTANHLSVTGKWLLIPKQGFMNTGSPIPKTIQGTTAGFVQVGAEITFANGPAVVTAPVKLSPTGGFAINANVRLPARHADPVVLIGPMSGKKMLGWFAATDFLTNYGQANAAVASKWKASGAPIAAKSGTGSKSGSASGTSSSGW